MLVFLNGQFLPEAGAFVPVNDRGFMLGDGLFETMRVVNGGPFRFAQHLERMTRGADSIEWRLVTSSLRIPASDALSSFKTTSKILNVLARVEAAEKGADEALLINTNGEVAETASGNLFWVYDDKICTVPTGRGVLPGITRAVVLEICQALGLPTNKRVIKPEALRNSCGIFVTQSALGIVPVISFDGEPVAPSPLVDQIAGAYNEMLMRG